MQECERKESDCEKSAREAEKQFKQECLKMGVKGCHLKKELLDLAQDVPAFFESLTLKCRQTLGAPVEFYRQFRRCLLQG